MTTKRLKSAALIIAFASGLALTHSALSQQPPVATGAPQAEPAETTAVLAESSGFSRLDEAAIRLARQVRIRPGTQDGKPVAGCMVVPGQI